ncbi:hypothetical protein F4861DRAFT_270598 [Xylaria intraflava]|nr:hypothetical protein F4861DRAFT_270598 [Xylaria intraflava]
MFRLSGKAILRRWHGILNLPRQTPATWYRDRYNEELVEFHQANTFVERLSEQSDVFFAISRAEYDGFPIEPLPQFRTRHLIVYAYMVAKYTSRWAFFRTVAVLCRAPRPSEVREVVNAGKDSKLAVVAGRHGVNAEKFTTVGRRLRRVWPLLP